MTAQSVTRLSCLTGHSTSCSIRYFLQRNSPTPCHSVPTQGLRPPEPPLPPYLESNVEMLLHRYLSPHRRLLKWWCLFFSQAYHTAQH